MLITMLTIKNVNLLRLPAWQSLPATTERKTIAKINHQLCSRRLAGQDVPNQNINRELSPNSSLVPN
jgi:hypothetical protein